MTRPPGTPAVRVVDQRPEGASDLPSPAFAAIAEPAQGCPQVQSERVDCPARSDNASHFQGSSAYYPWPPPRNHRQGVQSISILHIGSFVPMERSDLSA